MTDITTVTHGVILQQVNCKGVMGCGVALAIRNKWPVVYKQYRKHFKRAKLGMIQIIRIELKSAFKTNAELFIINLFAQDGYGRTKRYTNYDALDLCLEKVYDWWAENHRKLPIYIPYKMGCNNAGGDWKIVYNMIRRIIPAAEIVHLQTPEHKEIEQRFDQKLTRLVRDLQKAIVS